MRLLTLDYLEKATLRLTSPSHRSQSDDWKSKYVQAARKLPGFIQVSGLAQCALFVNASSNTSQQQVFADLSFLMRGDDGLSDALPSMSVTEYMQSVRRAQEALVVLKRLSASLYVTTEITPGDSNAR